MPTIQSPRVEALACRRRKGSTKGWSGSVGTVRADPR